ncbi:iron(III) transport system ATP-binding protein [Kribbella orskensis]|uniref:Iron(III) transport system ATP-binding protein n=1 Tax=Kribbella orskensis TaxID=2512216 RepID=A0ABY2BML6_9ACTN|nr:MULTISPECIES: ABC transporter ATP-binding protein [Kribbella]TCN41791.1 iron(III) transport system ATP-binding protein [Kribbella sp. VKM Ac-2500]TCO25669.1 iron(III) transport system ATP-binding protein [Kribbella orskensis]
MKSAGITISGLTVGYGGPPVLDQVSLQVRPGGTTAVLGPSGSGKTTLLRALAGFVRPARGRIEVDGKVLTGGQVLVAPERRGIGYVRQDGALFPHLDVTGNILFGLPRVERRRADQVGPLLELVGLSPSLARRRPDELSGGQQQRVALARALAREPAVVLLDEPFSSLDTALRAATREATLNALTARGATTVLVTHDQAEALSFADQVAVILDGRLAQIGSPAEVYDAPATPEVGRVLGDTMLLAGRADSRVVNCVLGTLDLAEPATGEVLVMIRPEQLVLGNPSGPAARVMSVAYHGPEAMVRLGLPDATTRLVARVPGHHAPQPGDTVHLTVPAQVRSFPKKHPHTSPDS